ncbi:vitamin B12 ABC transporter ATP-binding protein BtuD [Acerihabitans sp. TG2]|uniref:vitamin B12 ABC transporter ATP-binding protein BtuD n=1 Tax=Acerihabitans sp. TG2 TaxID=3096008 RepID=UPI002B22863C|nr:vitamin B12 ABC transporter ATP-binding protein BtuD [Acerihabitans sp. TG2]MEA9391086.1 vitamin B12 ABC transporter ATP-binding protein BtuD [Acerihabitans sp. TG2]
MVQALLECRSLSVTRRLHQVSVRVFPGQLVHIIGPNGAGKSTLLASIGGLLRCEGEITLLDKPLSQWHGEALALRRAYLHQQASPYAAMPVFQYLSLHQPVNVAEQHIMRTVDYLADALSLSDKLGRPLNRLSGGEWQRARLAAVLLQVWPTTNTRARLLLLDEPAASLDIAQRVALDRLLSELTALGLGVLVCAHDLNHSMQHAGEVWLMSGGKLAAQGAARDVMCPALLSPVFGVGFTLLQAGDRPWLIAHDGHPSAQWAPNPIL